MSMSARILPAFDQIIENTRKHLSSIPDDRLVWKPHEKSYAVGELGSHLANIPNWTAITLGDDSLDLDPNGPRAPVFGSSAEMVAALDEHAAAAHAAIEKASDEDLTRTWTLSVNGNEIFTVPKIAALRVFIMDHMIHHRGQLTVYLRLLDVPVQQTFGPTADFPDMQ